MYRVNLEEICSAFCEFYDQNQHNYTDVMERLQRVVTPNDIAANHSIIKNLYAYKGKKNQ